MCSASNGLATLLRRSFIKTDERCKRLGKHVKAHYRSKISPAITESLEAMTQEQLHDGQCCATNHVFPSLPQHKLACLNSALPVHDSEQIIQLLALLLLNLYSRHSVLPSLLPLNSWFLSDLVEEWTGQYP